MSTRKPSYLKKPFKPVKLSAVQLAFPADIEHLMPRSADIDAEFKAEEVCTPNPWQEFPRLWFAKGFPVGTGFLPKEGIVAEEAFQHLRAIMGSFQPKHEHKTSAVAFLASLWFHAVVDKDGNALIGSIPTKMQETPHGEDDQPE